MKANKYSFLVLFMVLTFNAFSCSKDKTEEASSNDQMKEQVNTVKDNKTKAPDFTLISTDGKKINLSDYKGKIVILDFWATWCGPCRMGVPDLVSIQKEFKDKVAVIGISLDDKRTMDDILPFMKEYGINYPVVYGTNQVVVDYGYIQAIPTTFIINAKGFIVDQYIGLVAKEKYVNTINGLMKES
jgi:thiol-disulfide isomerase/thioredoxin